MSIEQRDVEAMKAQGDYVEKSIERQRTALDSLSGRKREEFYWRLRRRQRELKVVRRRLAQLEEDLLCRDVLRDLENL